VGHSTHKPLILLGDQLEQGVKIYDQNKCIVAKIQEGGCHQLGFTIKLDANIATLIWSISIISEMQSQKFKMAVKKQ